MVVWEEEERRSIWNLELGRAAMDGYLHLHAHITAGRHTHSFSMKEIDYHIQPVLSPRRAYHVLSLMLPVLATTPLFSTKPKTLRFPKKEIIDPRQESHKGTIDDMQH